MNDYAPSPRWFYTHSFVLAASLLPVGYIAMIVAVGVHEILGHGLTAWLVGGTFVGFSLQWDGMGWAVAFAPPQAATYIDLLVYGSGILATTAAGAVLLLIVFRINSTYWRFVFLLLAFFCFEDGLPYLFWNAYHPSPPGDVARILELCGYGERASAAVIRWGLMLFGGLASFVCTIGCSTLLFRFVEQCLGNGHQLEGFRRAFALLMFVAFPGVVGWILFDWNQLAEGIGWMPNVVGAMTMIVIAVALYVVRVSKGDGSCTVTWKHIIGGWSGAALTVLLLRFWLQDGVHWG